MKPFHHLLANNLVANVTNYTVWFAVTFWVFIETQSVFATGMIAGIYLVFTAGFGFWLGSLVDHNPKKLVMLGSSNWSQGGAALSIFAAASMVLAALVLVTSSPKLWRAAVLQGAAPLLGIIFLAAALLTVTTTTVS